MDYLEVYRLGNSLELQRTMPHVSRNSYDSGFGDYMLFHVVKIFAHPELYLGIERTEGVGHIVANEAKIFLLGMVVTYLVKEYLRHIAAVGSIEISTLHMVSAAEICLILRHELTPVILGADKLMNQMVIATGVHIIEFNESTIVELSAHLLETLNSGIEVRAAFLIKALTDGIGTAVIEYGLEEQRLAKTLYNDGAMPVKFGYANHGRLGDNVLLHTAKVFTHPKLNFCIKGFKCITQVMADKSQIFLFSVEMRLCTYYTGFCIRTVRQGYLGTGHAQFALEICAHGGEQFIFCFKLRELVKHSVINSHSNRSFLKMFL